MLLVFDRNALEDLRYWVDTDRKKALKIIDLIDVSLKSPLKALESLSHCVINWQVAGHAASIKNIG